MQSAYCQALSKLPPRPFFANELVRRTAYYQRAESSAKVGAWIATPGFLAGKIEALDAQYQSLGKEMHTQFVALIDNEGVSAANKDPRGRFLSEVWTPMLGRWNEFVRDHSRWWDNLSGATWDLIKDHTNQLIKLREEAERVGYFFNAPKPLPQAKSPWDTVSFLLKAIVGALVGGAALYAASLLFKMIQTFRR